MISSLSSTFSPALFQLQFQIHMFLRIRPRRINFTPDFQRSTFKCQLFTLYFSLNTYFHCQVHRHSLPLLLEPKICTLIVVCFTPRVHFSNFSLLSRAQPELFRVRVGCFFSLCLALDGHRPVFSHATVVGPRFTKSLGNCTTMTLKHARKLCTGNIKVRNISFWVCMINMLDGIQRYRSLRRRPELEQRDVEVFRQAVGLPWKNANPVRTNAGPTLGCPRWNSGQGSHSNVSRKRMGETLGADTVRNNELAKSSGAVALWSTPFASTTKRRPRHAHDYHRRRDATRTRAPDD